MNAALLILERLAVEIEEEAMNPHEGVAQQMAQWAKEIRNVCATIRSLNGEESCT